MPPLGFEPRLQAPQAYVISKLHYKGLKQKNSSLFLNHSIRMGSERNYGQSSIGNLSIS